MSIDKSGNLFNDQLYIDDLTGIYNKRFLNKLVKEKTNKNITLCMFDIDDFKSVNDLYGHYAGDLTIREIGKSLQNISDKKMYPIRFGGDEFIIIFTDHNKEDVEAIISYLMKRFRNNEINVDGKAFKITCSFGISFGNTSDFPDLIKRADRALYASKDKGKNTYTYFSSDIRAAVNMPVSIERSIKTHMSSNKNIIITGGFNSGKTLLANNLKRFYPVYNIIESESDSFENMDPPFIILHNPAISISSEKIRSIYLVKKKFKCISFKMNNYSKREISEFLLKNNFNRSLLMVNYVDLLSSGNPGILVELLKHKNIYDFPKYRSEEIRGIISMVKREYIDALKKTIKLGLRFNENDIYENNLNQYVSLLNDSMILEKKNDKYFYSYPPIFFYYEKKNSKKMINKYSHIFDMADGLKKNKGVRKVFRGLTERIFSYGDMLTVENLLKNDNRSGDWRMELLARISAERGYFKEGYKYVGRIKDSMMKQRLNSFLNIKSGKKISFLNHNDTESDLIDLMAAISRNQHGKFYSIMEKINIDELDERQKMSYYFIFGLFCRARNETLNTLKYLRQAAGIASINHYIMDYAKIIMFIGMLHDDKGRHSNALDCLQKALRIFEISCAENSRESAMLNIAVVCSNRGDFDKALAFFSKLLANTDSERSMYFHHIILNNVSDMYLKWWKIDESEIYNQKCIELFKNSKMVIPSYVSDLRERINIAKNIDSMHIESINKNDIMDDTEREIVKAIINAEGSNKTIIEFAQTLIADKNGLSDFEISEYIAYIALCFRNKIVIRNKLLGLAIEVIDKKEYFLRRKQFKSLMEEK